MSFYTNHLSDTQAIIRTTDVKFGFLFAIVLLPITVLSDVYAITLNLASESKIMMVGLGLVLTLWFLSFYTFFLGVAEISNPYMSVSSDKAKGSFHGGGLFNFKLTDRFINRPVFSNYTVGDFVKMLPDDDTEIIQELVFEKIKNYLH